MPTARRYDGGMSLPLRPFGATGLHVSALGVGGGRLDDLTDDEARSLLDRALDLGCNLVDTARGYGRSEERIGRWLPGRRDRVVICTKGGYGVPGVPDWTGPCITAGVDAALGRLATDRIDVFFLHSCPVSVLEQGEVTGALEEAVRAGKVRAAGYSGEGEALAFAVRSGRFAVIETSVNLCDQRLLGEVLPEAAWAGLGVIAKRALANAPWRFPERPVGDYAEVYWERLQAMGIDPGELAWDELALRFSAFAPGVSTAIVGMASLTHLERGARSVGRGPLPEAQVAAIHHAFRVHDRGWLGQV